MGRMTMPRNYEREEQLISAAERALAEGGHHFVRMTPKGKKLLIGKDNWATQQKILLRTSADRWIACCRALQDDPSIDAVLVATVDSKEEPRAMLVYEPISAAKVRRHYEDVRAPREPRFEHGASFHRA
jgi:hypothetical protein